MKSSVVVVVGLAVKSLSSWRAWIEIMDMTTDSESGRSLSSWRAWIEISQGLAAGRHDAVALLMESVD